MTAATLKYRTRQLARYGAFGALATAVHYTLMAYLFAAGWFPVSASTAGAAAGALVAYAANRKWTFRAEHSNTRLLRFMAVAALGLLFNAILLATIHQWLIQSIIGAQLLTTGLVFVATFLINLKWSFA